MSRYYSSANWGSWVCWRYVSHRDWLRCFQIGRESSGNPVSKHNMYRHLPWGWSRWSAYPTGFGFSCRKRRGVDWFPEDSEVGSRSSSIYHRRWPCGTISRASRNPYRNHSVPSACSSCALGNHQLWFPRTLRVVYRSQRIWFEDARQLRLAPYRPNNESHQ